MNNVGLELFVTAICQNHLPVAPWMKAHLRKLPGIEPITLQDWIQIDDAYEAQMGRRDELISQIPEKVHRIQPHALPAAQELLDMVLQLTPELKVLKGHATRPDSITVQLDYDAPLLTLGRLVQEDFLIHERQGDQHVLVAAILCFPASWGLDEKFGRSIEAIHAPVEEFDARTLASVERMFKVIRHEHPMKRHNALRYSDPELFHPERGSDMSRDVGKYIRSERQSIVRLPKSNFVVFSVHTYQVHENNLTKEQAEMLEEFPVEHEEKPV